MKAFRLTFDVIAEDASAAHEAVFSRLRDGGEADKIEDHGDGFASTESEQSYSTDPDNV